MGSGTNSGPCLNPIGQSGAHANVGLPSLDVWNLIDLKLT